MATFVDRRSTDAQLADASRSTDCLALARPGRPLCWCSAPLQAHAACTGNAIVCENQLPGHPASVWDIDGAGDDASRASPPRSASTPASDPVQGRHRRDGLLHRDLPARLLPGQRRTEIATITPSATLPQNQPACATDPDDRDLRLRHLGASRHPGTCRPTAVSGVYIARLDPRRQRRRQPHPVHRPQRRQHLAGRSSRPPTRPGRPTTPTAARLLLRAAQRSRLQAQLQPSVRTRGGSRAATSCSPTSTR